MKPIRGQILEEAAHATLKTRHDVYGDPYADMDFTARLKALYKEHVGTKYSLAHEEAMDRIFLKIARIASGAYHRDNYIDAAAYFAIAAECEEKYQIIKQNKTAAECVVGAEIAEQLNASNALKKFEAHAVIAIGEGTLFMSTTGEVWEITSTPTNITGPYNARKFESGDAPQMVNAKFIDYWGWR